MLIARETVETAASKEAVWQVLQDVSNWPTWDHGIEYSTLDGPFQAGTAGTLKPKGGPRVNTLLTQVEPYKMFVDEAQLFFARIKVSHFLEAYRGKTIITHQIEMTGPLAFFFAIMIGKGMKKILPATMQMMIAQAETRENNHGSTL